MERGSECRSDAWRRLLGLYADGEADRADASRVRAHLTLCPFCRVELQRMRRMGKAIANLPVHAAPDYLSQAILARTVEAKVPLATRIYRARPVLRPALLGGVAAAFLAAITWAFDGVLSVVTSPATAILRSMASRATEAVHSAGELLDTLGVADTSVKVVRVLAQAGRTVLESPPPDLVLAAALALFCVLLVSARAVALRFGSALPSDRSVNHARLPL